ncbi:hypothetical protein PUN28_006374 [Cardiocondyla obscurior]|uniref:Uncharacterized protein n=1 Tax=Cardiocondyla obscurior TaxID=286306 RepID=A0AAW2GB84_9HYME
MKELIRRRRPATLTSPIINQPSEAKWKIKVSAINQSSFIDLHSHPPSHAYIHNADKRREIKLRTLRCSNFCSEHCRTTE